VVIYGVGGSSAVMAAELHTRFISARRQTASCIRNSYNPAHVGGHLESPRCGDLHILHPGGPQMLVDTVELAKHFGAKMYRHHAEVRPHRPRNSDICIDHELTPGAESIPTIRIRLRYVSTVCNRPRLGVRSGFAARPRTAETRSPSSCSRTRRRPPRGGAWPSTSGPEAIT